MQAPKIAVVPPAAPVPAPAFRPAPAPAPAPPPADESAIDLQATWRAVVAELKAQKKDMLASGMAHARVLGISGGRVRLGFTARDGMFHRQIERSQKDAEAAVSKVLGRPAGLVIETVDAASVEASPSIAEEDTERTRVREESATRETREHPSVLAAMRLLGGTIEFIKILEEEQDEAFASTPDEGEDAGQDEA